MASDISKEDMHRQITEAFEERNIDPKRTRLGTNVICRSGNPSSCHDLYRICANKAAACLIMMNAEDYSVSDTDSYLQNGATMRVLLALRYVILSTPYDSENVIHPALRIVVQMSTPSVYINTASFPSPTGIEVVHPLDLTLFANTLMFGCVAHRGMARTFLALLNLEGSCIRRRKATNFRCGPDRQLGDCIGRSFAEVAREPNDAILIGLVRPSHNTPMDLLEGRYGLCPDPGHLIREDDLIIFVSSVTSPHTSEETVNQVTAFEADAEKRVEADPLANETREVLGKWNVIVIGWRGIWETEANRFRHRLDEIFEKSLPGSTLTFVCSLEIESMRTLLELVGLKFERYIAPDGDGETTIQARRSMRGMTKMTKLPFVCNRAEYTMPAPYVDCKVIHVEGDGVLPEIIEPVIFERRIDTAIVLGTRAERRRGDEDDGFLRKDANTDGFHRDTRVLAMLLLLRKVHSAKGDQSPMHVVGENTEDLTEKLALYPAWKKRSHRSSVIPSTTKRRGTILSEHIRNEDTTHHLPDFVNTQAMYARALVQTLAYPLISNAITQLFDKRGASLELLRCSAFVPLLTPIPFGLVKAIVAARARKSYTNYNGVSVTQEAICLGYISSEGEQHLVPPVDEEIIFEDSCRLIAITRNDEDEDATALAPDYGDASSEFGMSRAASIHGARDLYGINSKLTGPIDEEEEEDDSSCEEAESDEVGKATRNQSGTFHLDQVFPAKADEDEIKYNTVPQNMPQEQAVQTLQKDEPLQKHASQNDGTENDGSNDG